MYSREGFGIDGGLATIANEWGEGGGGGAQSSRIKGETHSERRCFGGD